MNYEYYKENMSYLRTYTSGRCVIAGKHILSEYTCTGEHNISDQMSHFKILLLGEHIIWKSVFINFSFIHLSTYHLLQEFI